MMKDIIIVIPL